MATPLEELTTFKSKRAAMRAVLDALADLGGEVVGHKVGPSEGRTKGGFKSASTLLIETIDEVYRTNYPDTLQKLRDGGWIDAPVRGRQVPYVRLVGQLPWRGDTPTAPTETAGPFADNPVTVEPPAIEDTNGNPLLSLVSMEGDDETEELGVRPGRFAARLEKRLPALVAEAVTAAMTAERDAIYNSQGYYRGISPEQYQEQAQEIEAYVSQVAHLQSTIESLSDRNRQLETMLDWLSDQDDERLAKTNDGQVASKHSLTVHQVPEQHRKYAELALADGWTIKKTRGGHLAWRNTKTGKTVFGASTPGAQGTGIMARKLRRNGLVIDRVS